MEAAAVEYLSGLADLAAIVGARVYPAGSAQGAEFPYLVYQRISTVPTRTMDGDQGCRMARLQWSCFARTYAEAAAVIGLVEAAAAGFRGDVAGVRIKGAFAEGTLDVPQAPLGADSRGVDGRAVDWLVYFNA